MNISPVSQRFAVQNTEKAGTLGHIGANSQLNACFKQANSIRPINANTNTFKHPKDHSDNTIDLKNLSIEPNTNVLKKPVDVSVRISKQVDYASTLSTLPNDLLLEVGQLLDPASLLKLSKVNRRFNSLLSTESAFAFLQLLSEQQSTLPKQCEALAKTADLAASLQYTEKNRVIFNSALEKTDNALYKISDIVDAKLIVAEHLLDSNTNTYTNTNTNTTKALELTNNVLAIKTLNQKQTKRAAQILWRLGDHDGALKTLITIKNLTVRCQSLIDILKSSVATSIAQTSAPQSASTPRSNASRPHFTSRFMPLWSTIQPHLNTNAAQKIVQSIAMAQAECGEFAEMEATLGNLNDQSIVNRVLKRAVETACITNNFNQAARFITRISSQEARQSASEIMFSVRISQEGSTSESANFSSSTKRLDIKFKLLTLLLKYQNDHDASPVQLKQALTVALQLSDEIVADTPKFGREHIRSLHLKKLLPTMVTLGLKDEMSKRVDSFNDNQIRCQLLNNTAQCYINQKEYTPAKLHIVSALTAAEGITNNKTRIRELDNSFALSTEIKDCRFQNEVLTLLEKSLSQNRGGETESSNDPAMVLLANARLRAGKTERAKSPLRIINNPENKMEVALKVSKALLVRERTI